jgi:hypothetical protein
MKKKKSKGSYEVAPNAHATANITFIYIYQ